MFCQRDETGYKLLTEGVRFRSLVHGEKTHLCEFRIAKGVKVPEHSHPHEQTGYLISGRMKLIVGNESLRQDPATVGVFPGLSPMPCRSSMTRSWSRSFLLCERTIWLDANLAPYATGPAPGAVPMP